MEKITAKDILQYHLIFRNAFKDILRFDKTPISQFEILMIINETGGLKVGELSHKMSITRPNLTPLVDELEAEGYIVRKVDEKDKRITRLFITQSGKEKLSQNLQILEERLEVEKEQYTEKELEEIKKYCDKLIQIIEKK